MQEGRLFAISFMRVLAMTMIVAFHSMLLYTGKWWQFNNIESSFWSKLARLLDSIDLSMFVYISGFLYGYLLLFKGKYLDRNIFILNKTRRLIIPYIVWGVFMVCIQPSIHSWDLIIVGISHLWFLLMLFVLFCAVTLLMSLKVYALKGVKLLMFLLLLYFLWLLHRFYSPHHYFLCIEKALFYSLPFFLGFYSAKFKIWEYSNSVLSIIWAFSFVILFVYIFFIPEFDYYYNDIVIRFISFIFAVSFFIYLNGLVISKWISVVILFLDRYSMGIYIFNQIVINFMLLNHNVLDWLIDNPAIGVFVIFFISFFVPLIISIMFKKFKSLSWMIGE